MASLNWDRLRLFLLVARAKSLNAASQKSALDQSTISRHMLMLEKELGLTLFNRSSKGSVVTAAGETILQLAVQVESKIKLIEARAAEEMGLAGKIRLWVSEGIGGYWLPPRMREFHRRYPAVTIEVLCSTVPPPEAERDVDVTLSWHEPEHAETVVLSKGLMTLKPCASFEYLETYGTPKSLEELQNHKLCNHLLYPKYGEWRVWADLVENHPKVSYITNSSWALGEVTINGVGISLQPVGVEAREPSLKLLNLDGYAPKLEFWLSCHRKIKDIPRIRALIEYLKSEFFLKAVVGSPFMLE
jgi:DNA-binding transcriptional LysR family regulator